MIQESTYVTIARAAELLKTDVDSVLVSALDGVMTLYWAFNQTIHAELVGVEGGRANCAELDVLDSAGGDNPIFLNMLYSEKREFPFVPLTKTSLSAIVNTGAANVSNDPMSLPDVDGYWWQAVSDCRTELPNALGQKGIFAKLSDCEVSPQAQEMHARNRNTMLVIMAAVFKEHNIEYANRGIAKHLEGLTELLGIRVNEDTIKKILDDIPKALKSRMKPRG